MMKDPIANEKIIMGTIQNLFNQLKNEFGPKTQVFAIRTARYTTLGGDATEEIALPGIKENMICSVQIHTEGAAPVTIKSAKCEFEKLTIEFSADPDADHIIEYIIFK